jgi:uncharacterized protein YgiM (DUF1202 family)
MNTFINKSINRWLFVGSVALLAGFASFVTVLPHAHASGAFEIGDRVVDFCTGNLNVRGGAGTTYPILGTHHKGDLGTVLGGPVRNTNNWWNIKYDASPSDWSTQSCLAKYFTIGERVQVENGPLNVRTSAGTSATILGTQATGVRETQNRNSNHLDP